MRPNLVALAVGVVLLSSCGVEPDLAGDHSPSPPIDVTQTPGVELDPPQEPAMPDFGPGDVQVVQQSGNGATALPHFTSASFRMLVTCRGAPLEVHEAARELARTKCDGVTLDARVASADGRKDLGVVAAAGTTWTVRIARTSDDWFRTDRPG